MTACADRAVCDDERLQARNAIRYWMEQGLVDAGIMVCTERVPDAFSTEPLVVEQLLLVGDRKARLRLDAPVSIAALAKLPAHRVADAA